MSSSEVVLPLPFDFDAADPIVQAATFIIYSFVALILSLLYTFYFDRILGTCVGWIFAYFFRMDISFGIPDNFY